MNDPIATIYADPRALDPMVVISFDAGPNCIVTQAISAEAARRLAIRLFRSAKESRLKHKQLVLLQHAEHANVHPIALLHRPA